MATYWQATATIVERVEELVVAEYRQLWAAPRVDANPRNIGEPRPPPIRLTAAGLSRVASCGRIATPGASAAARNPAQPGRRRPIGGGRGSPIRLGPSSTRGAAQTRCRRYSATTSSSTRSRSSRSPASTSPLRSSSSAPASETPPLRGGRRSRTGLKLDAFRRALEQLAD